MAMAIAPMLGPMIGGALDELFGWQSSFVVYVTIGTALFFLTWWDLAETNQYPSDTIGRHMRIYPVLLRSRRFWGYASCMMFSTGAFYAFLAGAPLVVRVLFDMSAGTLGLYMGSITGGFFLGSFCAARLAKDHALVTVMLTGRIIACIGLATGLAIFASGVVHEFALFGATIFVGVGNGITMPSGDVGAMSVRSDLAGSASGLAGALTVGGGAILTWVTGVVVTEETGAMALLGMMFVASFLSLLSAGWVAVIEKRTYGLDTA